MFQGNGEAGMSLPGLGLHGILGAFAGVDLNGTGGIKWRNESTGQETSVQAGVGLWGAGYGFALQQHGNDDFTFDSDFAMAGTVSASQIGGNSSLSVGATLFGMTVDMVKPLPFQPSTIGEAFGTHNPHPAVAANINNHFQQPSN